MINALLVTIYWLSLPFIGYVLLLFLRNKQINFGGLGKLASAVLKQHAFITFLLSFVVVVGLFSIVAIPAYLFNAPIVLVQLLYIVLLFTALGYWIVVFLKNTPKTIFAGIKNVVNQPLIVNIVFLGLVLVLIFDYCMSLYVKTNADGDTLYHLARITTILNDGFTVSSGHYSGVMDAAYHFNILYPLYAIPAGIFSMAPMEVSKWSLGFFRLIQWLTVFSLVWYVVKKWLKSKDVLILSSICTIFAISLLSGDMFIATYPNKVVMIWLTLIVIGISLYESGLRKMMVAPLILLAILATLTHANAMIGALFIAFFYLYKLLTGGFTVMKDKLSLIFYVGLALILMIGPAITALMPSFLTEEQEHLGDFPLVHVLGMSFRSPVADFLSKNPTELVAIAVGIVGTILILKKVWKNRAQRSIVLALSTFYIFIMYCPPIFTVLNHFLPMWAIDRFSAMNILFPILFPIGIYAVLNFITSKNTLAKKVVLIVVTAVVSAFLVYGGYTQFVSGKEYKMEVYERLLRAEKDFGTLMKNNEVILGSSSVSYELSSVLNVDAVAVYAGHSTSTADTSNRILCRDYMLTQLKYEDLLATKVKFLIVSKSEPGETNLGEVSQRPYLAKVAENNDYIVYEVNLSTTGIQKPDFIYPPCLEYLKNENSNK